MKKDFIMDGKHVRNCDSNVAKMNLFEVIRYANVGPSIDWKEYFISLGAVIIIPLYLLTLPISIFIPAYIRRKRAKRRCEEYYRKKDS